MMESKRDKYLVKVKLESVIGKPNSVVKTESDSTTLTSSFSNLSNESHRHEDSMGRIVKDVLYL